MNKKFKQISKGLKSFIFAPKSNAFSQAPPAKKEDVMNAEVTPGGLFKYYDKCLIRIGNV